MAENKSFIDSPFAKWILAIFGIVGTVFGFFGYFHIANPKIVYEIQSKAVLFNRTEALSSVRLYVDSLDVLQSNQNISIYTFKVSNKGSSSLTSDHYDDGAFGIKVSNGDIIKEPTVGDASNDHIIERYHDLSPSSTLDFVEIPHIALDKGEWYSFSLAILHTYDSEPTFLPIGKIIGQKELYIAVSSEELPFWDSVFYGDWFVTSIRAVLYFLILLIVILVLVLVVNPIVEFEHKRKVEKTKTKIAMNSRIPGFVRDDFVSVDVNRRAIINIAWYYYSLGTERLNEYYCNAKQFVLDSNNLGDSEFIKMRQIYLDINRLVAEKYLSIDNNGIIMVPQTLEESVKTIIKDGGLQNEYSPEIYITSTGSLAMFHRDK